MKKKDITGELLYTQMNHRARLDEIAGLIDDGKVKVHIAEVYPLEDVLRHTKKAKHFMFAASWCWKYGPKTEIILP